MHKADNYIKYLLREKNINEGKRKSFLTRIFI